MAKRRNRKPRRVAVFDIDGTVFRSSLTLELMEALVAAGVFPQSAKRHYADAWRRWQARHGSTKSGFSYYEYIEKLVRAYVRHIRGKKQEDVWRVAQQVIAFHQLRVYRFTRDLVKKLKRQGYYRLAISHSPRDVVAPFAEAWGFDKVYATVFEFDGRERFTGRVLYSGLIMDKAKIVKRAIVREELTLKGSVGVGDTESDIPFLKMVERPITFNPSGKLHRYAKRHGWEIVVERKDVIYRLNSRR